MCFSIAKLRELATSLEKRKKRAGHTASHYMMYGYYNYPTHLFGSLFMALFWIVVLFVVIRFLQSDRSPWNRHAGPHAGNRPLDILKERYAKGEITKEQFEEMKKEVG